MVIKFVTQYFIDNHAVIKQEVQKVLLLKIAFLDPIKKDTFETWEDQL